MFKYKNAREANAEIARLEEALGLPGKTAFIGHMKAAHDRIEQLLEIKDRLEGHEKQETTTQTTAPAPSVAQGAPVAPAGATAGAPLTATAPALPTLSRSQCRAVFTDVFHEGVALGLTDAELLEDTLTRIQAERLTLPGASKADCSGLDTRAKMFRSQRQDRLERVLKTVK